MDYSTIPTALIYQKKTLDKISELHALNSKVLQNMLDIESLHNVDFEEFALPCFNNAYYICTLMRMEKNAEYRLNSYKKIALNGNAKNTLAQCVTLSLVAILTEHCSQSWREKLLGVSNKLKDHAKGLWIERQNEILFPFSSPGDKPVYNNEMVHLICMPEAMSRGIDENIVLSDELFAPRPIDEKALRDLGREDYHFEWAKWTQYYDEDIVRELVEGLGATQQDKAILIRSLWEKSNSYYVGDYPKQYVEPLLKSLAEKFCPDCLQMTELYLDESTGTMTPETPLPSHQAPATASPVPNSEQQSIIEQQAIRIKELTAEIEELKQTREDAKNEDWVVELFSHFCYEDIQVAQSIINEMRDKTDPEIADIIFERLNKNNISPKTRNIDIWRVLHAAKIIESDSYQNLDTALRRRRKRKQ